MRYRTRYLLNPMVLWVCIRAKLYYTSVTLSTAKLHDLLSFGGSASSNRRQ